MYNNIFAGEGPVATIYTYVDCFLSQILSCKMDRCQPEQIAAEIRCLCLEKDTNSFPEDSGNFKELYACMYIVG